MFKYIFLLCLFQTNFVEAYFSQTYDFGELNIVYSSSILYESDTTAIAYSTCRDGKTATLNIFRIHLVTKKILTNKKYDFTPEKIQGYYYLSLIKSRYFDGYYAAFNIGDSLFKNVQTIFFKLDIQLDTLYTFRTDTTVVVAGSSIIEGPDSCIYFTGSHYYYNYFDSCQTALFKFSSNGKLVFQKFYNVGLLMDGGGNIRFSSSNCIYIAGGQRAYSTILNEFINQPFLLKTDNNGNLLGYKNFGQIDKNERGWALEILNDTIYVCGKRGNAYIAVIDTALNEINHFNIPVIQDTLQAFDIIFQLNNTGNIIISATAERPYLKYPDGKYIKIRLGGYIGKMNRHTGKILWERMYNSIPDTVGVNYISGLNITPSNNILLIGSGLKKKDGHYKNYDWILYLDSNGCLADTVCGEWSRVPVTSSISNNLKSGIKIYPNPVTDFVIIKNEWQTYDATYQIINLNGQVMHEGKIETDETKIETGHWNAGMYIVRIQNIDGTYIERIIKE